MTGSPSKLPVDRGWAWTIVLGHFMNLFFMVGIAKSIGILLEEFHLHFEVPMAVATMVMSVTGIVYAFAAPLSILVAEKFTARRVIMVSGVVALVMMALSSLLVNMVYVILLFGVGFGLGNAAIYGNGLILLGQYFKKRRSLANGLALSGSSIGQFVLPPVIQFFLETYSLGGTVLLISALYFHVTLFGSLFRPISYYQKDSLSDEDQFVDILEMEKCHDSDVHEKAKMVTSNGEIGVENMSDHHDHDDHEVHAVMASTGSIYLGSVTSLEDMTTEHNASRIYKDQPNISNNVASVLRKMFDFSVLKNYVCVLYVIVSFLGFFGHFNFVLFLPSFALTKGITKYNKALLVSICGACDLAGRVLFGFVGDLNIIQRYKIKSICLILLAVNTGMFIFADTFAWIAVHSALYGFLGGGFVGMIAVVLIDLVGLEKMARVLGVVLLVQGIGAATGQPLLGLIKDMTGQYDIVIYICSSCCLVSGILLLCWPMVRRMEKRRQEHKGTTT
ncbi:monocarboxylate transporter 12-like [Haliotis cracherodii]|uniref:monocarboxylate transporter 12-like n=1 Tax=Haliotis cracherodii TaxID=6455 RepID=UPI0039E7D800